MTEAMKFANMAAQEMSRARPDIWSYGSAHETILSWMDRLMEGSSGGSISSGGFRLFRHMDEFGVEFSLVRSIVDLNEYEDGAAYVFEWLG